MQDKQEEEKRSKEIRNLSDDELRKQEDAIREETRRRGWHMEESK